MVDQTLLDDENDNALVEALPLTGAPDGMWVWLLIHQSCTAHMLLVVHTQPCLRSLKLLLKIHQRMIL